MTQEALAEKLGVTVGAVCHWETGRSIPGGPTRKLLAIYLGITEDEVARGFEDGGEIEPAEEPRALEGAA